MGNLGFYSPSGWSRLWTVRFSPVKKGTWSYVVKVTDREGTAQSRPGTFTVTDAAHHGFIRIAPNQRYLRYDDGTSFCGVGLWYNDSYEQFSAGQITEAKLDRLKQLGDFVFGWVVNPRTSVAEQSFTISGLDDGSNEVRLYRTWRGRYSDTQTLQCRDGRPAFTRHRACPP